MNRIIRFFCNDKTFIGFMIILTSIFWILVSISQNVELHSENFQSSLKSDTVDLQQDVPFLQFLPETTYKFSVFCKLREMFLEAVQDELYHLEKTNLSISDKTEEYQTLAKTQTVINDIFYERFGMADCISI